MPKAGPRYQNEKGPALEEGRPFSFWRIGEFFEPASREAAQVRVEAGVAGRHN